MDNLLGQNIFPVLDIGLYGLLVCAEGPILQFELCKNIVLRVIVYLINVLLLLLPQIKHAPFITDITVFSLQFRLSIFFSFLTRWNFYHLHRTLQSRTRGQNAKQWGKCCIYFVFNPHKKSRRRVQLTFLFFFLKHFPFPFTGRKSFPQYFC